MKVISSSVSKTVASSQVLAWRMISELTGEDVLEVGTRLRGIYCSIVFGVNASPLIVWIDKPGSALQERISSLANEEYAQYKVPGQPGINKGPRSEYWIRAVPRAFQFEYSKGHTLEVVTLLEYIPDWVIYSGEEAGVRSPMLFGVVSILSEGHTSHHYRNRYHEQVVQDKPLGPGGLHIAQTLPLFHAPRLGTAWENESLELTVRGADMISFSDQDRPSIEREPLEFSEAVEMLLK